ncbi:MAG: 4-hydroxybenzoate octaprenyltransferase [Aquificaceae bacterium]|nr:MAG: 4-hydroxybenzoate octaprenyltransferase [Aquificaceae bacterium]
MLVSTIKEHFPYYLQLIRFDRPIGTYLVLWPTLWALWLASNGIPDVKLLIIFALGAFTMRSAGCAINDFADRKVDGKVERTKNRPLAIGAISPKEALMVFAVLSFVAFILVLQLNLATILLSTVALLLAASYPFMKRYHSLPQVHLGAAFAWSVPMAFTAVTADAPPFIAWLLFAVTLLWTTAYDTMYGMVDREDDLKIGVKSTAILFAEKDKLIIGILQGLSLLLLILIGVLASRGWVYYAGIAVATGLAVYQQQLIKDREPKQCFTAFLNNNWFGMAVFIGLALDYWV